MTAPTRVRLTDSCPWPERRGATGVVVHRPAGVEGTRYPWAGLGANEVVVLLDDDPLGTPGEAWSCALSWKYVEPEPSIPMGRLWEEGL